MLKWSVTEHFKEYLAYAPFTVCMDNNPLTYMLTTPNLDATTMLHYDKNSFRTQNSSYNMTKIPSEHKIPVTISQKFFQNTIFRLQYHKNASKN